MPIRPPAISVPDFGAAIGQGTQNALGQAKLTMLADQYQQQNQISSIGQASTPQNYAQNLQSAGFMPEAQAFQEKQSGIFDENFERQFTMLRGVNDQDTWDVWVNEMEANSGIAEGVLPREFDPAVKEALLAETKNKVGASEFERLVSIPKGKRSELQQSRLEVLGGMKARPSSSPFYFLDKGPEGVTPVHKQTLKQETPVGVSGTQKRHEAAQKRLTSQDAQRLTNELRDEASKGTQHVSTISTNINEAIAALNSGDSGLSDTLLNQVMSQVQDTDVRAFQMYSQFDRSFGNLAMRVADSISRFLTGARTEEQNELIKETLVNFRDQYAAPAETRMRNMYRNLAKDEGVDPFEVVPPKRKEEIRDMDISAKEKMRLLELYFKDDFSGVR